MMTDYGSEEIENSQDDQVVNLRKDLLRRFQYF